MLVDSLGPAKIVMSEEEIKADEDEDMQEEDDSEEEEEEMMENDMDDDMEEVCQVFSVIISHLVQHYWPSNIITMLKTFSLIVNHFLRAWFIKRLKVAKLSLTKSI